MKFKLALFTSHLIGISILNRLLTEDLPWEVSMVASDDPTNPICNPKNRVWRYGDFQETLPVVIEHLANAAGIAVEYGNVNSTQFIEKIKANQIDAILICVFGQIIGKDLRAAVDGQVWNIHPTSNNPWPDCGGPDAYEQLLNGRYDSFRLMLHVVDQTIDRGREIEPSAAIPISRLDDVISLIRKSAPVASELAVRHLESVAKLQSAKATQAEPAQLKNRITDSSKFTISDSEQL